MKYVILFFVVLVSTQISIAQVPNYVPTNGLAAWYPFNGNANDESGNGNNGAVNGATLTTDRFGNPDAAYSYDGNDWIQVPHHSSIDFDNTDSFSVSVWINRDDYTDQGQSVLEKWYSTQFGPYPYQIRTGWLGTSFSFSSGSFDGSGGQTVSTDGGVANVDNHIVLVYNNGNRKLYVDGIEVDDTTSSIGSFNNNDNLYIGRRGNVGNRYYHGVIDDIGIWGRAITPCEIGQLYASQVANPTATVSTNGTTALCLGSDVVLTASLGASYLWSNGETTQSITVTDADDYSVTVTDEIGCISTSQSVTVTVNPNPTVTLTPYDAICANAEALTLMGGSPSGGSYTVNGNSAIELDPSVTGNGNQTVVYTYSDQNNCVGSATQLVVVNSIPNVSLSGLNTNYTLSDNPSTLVGTPSGGFFNGVAVSNGMFDPADAGLGTHGVSYAVVDGNGCIGVSSVCTTVDINVGIGGGNQISNGGGLDIYPNPNNGNFNLFIQDIKGLITYEIIDVRGREVLNGSFVSFGDHQETVNLSKAVNGVYTIHLNTPNGGTNRKLVKD